MRAPTILLILTSLLGVSCAARQASIASPHRGAPGSCDAFERWHIAFAQSGGLEGLVRGLELDSSGRAVAVERGARRPVPDLDPEELLRFRDLLAGACPFEGAPSGTCHDCFLYDMTIELDGARFEASIDDAALAGSELQALVRALRVRLTAALH